MTLSDSSSTQTETVSQPQSLRHQRRRDLLHYLAYFSAVGALTFIAQTGEPKQAEQAILAGAISAGAVISRDWYKARLEPNLAADPTAFIGLFSEMLQAGRAQANRNTAQLQRVELLQTDLVEAMRDFNDLLRLDPAAVEQQLKAIQATHLTSALPMLHTPYPNGTNGSIHNATDLPHSSTHVPDSTTVRQSQPIRRPGFDA